MSRKDATRGAVDAREAEDRRGRRASWVALGVACVVVVGAFVGLADRHAADRYENLRNHRTRANRFTIERLVEKAPAHAGRITLIVTIDGLDLDTWAGVIASHGYRTLDSLDALGGRVAIDGERGRAELLRHVLAALGDSVTTVAIPGRPEAPDGLDLSAFDRVRDGWPDVTDWLEEGEAGWSAIEAIRTIEETPGDLCLWLRYPELLPPVVAHGRFRVPRAVNEQVAIDHYLGRLLAYLRAADATEGLRVVVTNEAAARLLVVGVDDLPGEPVGYERLVRLLRDGSAG